MMDLRLEGKVVVVSGGARGIGRAIAEAFVAEGARVLVADRDDSSRGALAAAGIELCAGELAGDDACRRVVATAVERFGGVDVLVNNAGCNDAVGLEAGADAFVASLRANLVHAYALAGHARAALVRARGAIVNLGSKVALTGQGGTSGYAAAKGALLALTREWAVELAPHGVRVNAVNPGVVVTNLHRRSGFDDAKYAAFLERSKETHPLGRAGDPDEIAELIWFLASDRAGWITGETISIDGGRHLTCAR
jgi:L-fucose dehydrogenase